MSNIRLPPPSETPPPPYQAESDPISQGSPSSPPTSGTNRDREESSVSLSRMIGEESEDRHSEDLPPYPHPTVQQWSPANIAVTHRSRGAASVHRYEPLTRYEMIENAAIPVDLTSQATNLQTDQLHNTLNLGCHVTCMSFTTITKIRQYYYNSREPAFFTDSSVPLDELAESARTRWNNDSADLIWYQSHDWACAVCDRPAGGMIPHVQDYNHPEEDSDQVRWNICTPVCDNNGDCRTEADEWTRDCRDWANKMMRDRKRCANCSKRLGIPMIPCSKCWLVGYCDVRCLFRNVGDHQDDCRRRQRRIERQEERRREPESQEEGVGERRPEGRLRRRRSRRARRSQDEQGESSVASPHMPSCAPS